MIFNIQNIKVLDKLEERHMPIMPNNKGLRINVGNVGRLTLNGLIQEFNARTIFNPLINSVIPIYFENFDSFGKVKTILRNYFSKDNFESSIAHYSSINKYISIFQGVMVPTIKDHEIKEKYIKLLNSVKSPDFIIKFFVFHEIGHAIHDVLLKQGLLNVNNISDYFNELENKGNFYNLNRKFGYLDSVFGLNSKDTKNVITYLQEEINYRSPYGYNFHAESFNEGKTDYLSEENKKTKNSINNILKIRAMCVEKNNYKNKNSSI